MKKIDIYEIRNRQLNMLEYFDKICEENNLKYSLCGGTLIGAVRHKGYIPWDDDIDVFMPRKDYNKFIALFNNNDKYSIATPLLVRPYPYTYSKILDNETILIEYSGSSKNEYSIYIDVFPVECLPNDEKKLNSLYRTMKFLVRKYIIINTAPNVDIKKVQLIKRPFWLLRKAFFYIGIDKFLYKKISNLTSENITADRTGTLVAGYGKREIMDFNIFEELIELEFEGKLFKCTSKYHEYLSSLYGDYMKLPPVDQRNKSHNYDAYIK